MTDKIKQAAEVVRGLMFLAETRCGDRIHIRLPSGAGMRELCKQAEAETYLACGIGGTRIAPAQVFVNEEWLLFHDVLFTWPTGE